LLARAQTAALENYAEPQEQRIACAVALARLELLGDFESAEQIWRALERNAHLTPYQRFDFLRLWQKHIGTKEAVEPMIAVGYDSAGEPLCLLPLGTFPHGPFRAARFLGGKHANYNFGLWRKGAAFDAAFVKSLIAEISSQRPDLATLELHNQPLHWHGLDNPFLCMPHQPSPSPGYRLKLGEPGEAVLARQLTASYRGRIRGKERKLAKLEDYRYFVASTPEDVKRIMDAFFVQKREYMALQKIPNPFEEPEVKAFLREAALTGALEIHALEGGGEVLALYAGLSDGERLSTMISSFTASENSRNSPGIITIAHMVANAADRGFTMLDLGVGEAEYKFVFCDQTEDLFDSYLPLSAAGHALVPLMRAQAGLKRFVKTTPALWRMARAVRGVLRR
jgi:CelD/BcsL family acetyltransferase involved in cellulose biosynthesis